MWKSQDTIENLSPIRRLGCLKANFYYEGIYAEYLWGFLSKTFGSYHLLENILALADWEATYITHDIESFCPKLFFLLRKGLKRRIEVVCLSFRTAWRTCPTLTRSSRRRSRCWRRPKSRGRWPKRTKHSSQTLPTWQTGVDTHLLLPAPFQ